MHDAFVLAAGLGTRLRPLTDHRPKPLVPVCGVPMLSYSLALCARHGLTDVVVNAHWLAEQIVAWEGVREGVRVTVSVEPEILGTGGGLRNVAAALADRFAVVNADVLCDVNLDALIAAVPAEGAAMALRPIDADRYGIVAADASGTVVRLVDVATAVPAGAVASDTHFTGIHAMSRASLDRVPTGFQCIIRTTYRELVPLRRVAGVRHAGLWLDVGDPDAYLATNLAALAGGLGLPIDPHARAAYARSATREYGDRAVIGDARVDGPVWIGHGAKIGAGVVLRNAIVGDNATVEAGAVIEAAVIWDGVTVSGSLSGAVAHDGGTWRR